MELEEMKASWAELSARIDESVRINTMMVRRMVERDSRRAKGRLVTNEWAGILVIMALLPLIIWRFDQMLHGHNHIEHILVWVGCGIVVFALAITIVKLFLLSKIDPTHDIAGNISAINRFNIWIRGEKLVGIALVAIFIIVTLMFLWPVRAKIEVWRWGVFVAGILISPVLLWLQYGKIYRRNIEAISRSLDELRELDDK